MRAKGQAVCKRKMFLIRSKRNGEMKNLPQFSWGFEVSLVKLRGDGFAWVSRAFPLQYGTDAEQQTWTPGVIPSHSPEERQVDVMVVPRAGVAAAAARRA